MSEVVLSSRREIQPERESQVTARSMALLAHRYVGLIMALFLLIAGLTGSALAFRHELEAIISPQLLRAKAPSPDSRPLDPLELRDALEATLPGGAQVTYTPLAHEPGKAMLFFVEPALGSTEAIDDEFFVDPYTGEVLGSRTWGDLGQGAKNLIPFVYRLHFGLALGTVGSYLLGIIALLWTVDCFVGAYLTLPSRRRRVGGKPGRSWLRRWKPSWLVKATKLFSLVFTWHRASGLWVWAMLLVFAWSAVGMNLTEVYNPVMNTAFGLKARAFESLPVLETPRASRLSWPSALDQARSLMRGEASGRDFDVLEERGLSYYASRGMFQYRVRSSLDISKRYPSTVIWFDGDTGEQAIFEAPTGERAGNTITSWINHLHFGSISVGGLPYRIFVSLTGVAVALLSITGIWIWWRKRKKRRNARQKASGASAIT